VHFVIVQSFQFQEAVAQSLQFLISRFPITAAFGLAFTDGGEKFSSKSKPEERLSCPGLAGNGEAQLL
jgi:hypothetical protein